MKTIRTRMSMLRALDMPSTWCNETDHLNPNDKIYITTEKPASDMSIEELEQLIEDKRADAIIAKAKAQLYDALDILKTFGADVDVRIIGLDDEGE